LLSIRTSTAETIKHVYSKDPSLDLAACDFASYLKDGKEEHLKFKDGALPTRFILRRLSRAQWLHCAGHAFPKNEAVRFGLRGVENLTTPEGQPIVLEFADGPLGSALKDVSLDLVFAASLFVELGSRIMNLSEIADPT
jgi:hypothetical protein